MIKIYETAKDTDKKLTHVGSTEFVNFKDDFHKTIIRVLPQKEYQEILGFGAAFTESAAYTYYQMSEEKRKEIIEMFFCKEKGINYRFCRTHINSCDFSLGNYAHVEDESDIDLESFSIKRDKKTIIPLIKEAQATAGEDITFFSSPWSPPAWMKTNGEMNNGGELKEEYHRTWAKYYVKYIEAYKSVGIDIWGITIQNEPEATQIWDSCIYTSEQERDFIKNHLGPVFEETGNSDVKIMVHDHNRDRMFERSRVILDDPEANKYVWGAANHWYCGDNYENLTAFNECYPDKNIIFSEGTQENGNHHGSWALGERYARNIINDMNRGTKAWTDWNLILDTTGGPNHVYNLCSAPIMVDVRTDHYVVENSYYYIGHFSKFVDVGARRVLTTTTNDNIEVIGFKNPDNSIVIVLLNRNDKNIDLSFVYGDKMIDLSLVANSIKTLVF